MKPVFAGPCRSKSVFRCSLNVFLRSRGPVRWFLPMGAIVAAIGMIGAAPSASGQEKPGPQTNVATHSKAESLYDSPLNATEEELSGILSPEDRIKAIKRWDSDIARFEKLDKSESYPENSVMLLGSSSIRLWKQAAEMLAPYPIIQRGYGGARHADMVVFARRLISPHQFRALVVFIANDITGSKEDRTVEEVHKMVMHLIGVARQYQPDSPILLVEVTPTQSRWKVWPEIRSLNAMFREVALTEPNVYCLATSEYYLTANDMPRTELFIGDQLHQNEAGYLIWGDLIRRRLDEILSDEEVQVNATAG